jgi:hypothetical protein
MPLLAAEKDPLPNSRTSKIPKYLYKNDKKCLCYDCGGTPDTAAVQTSAANTMAITEARMVAT